MNDEQGQRWAKYLFYIGWTFATIFYLANFWFMNYGVKHAIYRNPFPGVEYFDYYVYTLKDMVFMIPVSIAWFILTLIIVLALEDKLREKTMSFMQRVWKLFSWKRAVH